MITSTIIRLDEHILRDAWIEADKTTGEIMLVLRQARIDADNGSIGMRSNAKLFRFVGEEIAMLASICEQAKAARTKGKGNDRTESSST